MANQNGINFKFLLLILALQSIVCNMNVCARSFIIVPIKELPIQMQSASK